MKISFEVDTTSSTKLNLRKILKTGEVKPNHSFWRVTPMPFAKPPKQTRNAKPGTYRHNKNHRHIPRGQQLPDDVGKSGEPQAAKRRAYGIHPRDLSPSRSLLYSSALFFLALMLVN